MMIPFSTDLIKTFDKEFKNSTFEELSTLKYHSLVRSDQISFIAKSTSDKRYDETLPRSNLIRWRLLKVFLWGKDISFITFLKIKIQLPTLLKVAIT